MPAVDMSWPETAAAELPTATPDRCDAFIVERDVGVPARDGVRLSANVFRPPGDGPCPAVLIRLPYGKDEHPTMWARGKYWARKGYACVIQDVRGKFDSGGRWAPFVNEAADGYDTLDWVAAQPWCDGNIGMAGESYHGLTQWAVAGLGHPNLRCIAPGDVAPDPYDLVYRSGAFLLPMALWACQMAGDTVGEPAGFDPWHLPLETLDEELGRPSTTLRAVLEHRSRDEFWRRVDFLRTASRVTIPVLHLGGWFDLFLHGTMAGWRAMISAGTPSAVRDRQWLVVGPTDHALAPARYGADGYAGADSPGAWSFDRVQRFFDHWLRHEDDGLLDEPRVWVFEMGAERWRSGPAWPLPGTVAVELYLRGDAHGDGGGRLDRATPADEPPDSFDYDPRAPVDAWLGEDAWELTWTRKERAEVEARDDVLLYTSDRLSEPLAVGGPLLVRLFVSSSAPCTDLSATLVDVFPDGRSFVVQEGLARVSGAPGEPVGAPGPQLVTIELGDTCYRFASGHHVRLEVSSSIFGRYDRNPNTGLPFGGPEDCVVARQVVYHSRAFPSRLTLPVMPAEREDQGPDDVPAPTPLSRRI